MRLALGEVCFQDGAPSMHSMSSLSLARHVHSVVCHEPVCVLVGTPLSQIWRSMGRMYVSSVGGFV